MGKRVYCHFSFRRNTKDTDKNAVILATAIYADEEARLLVALRVRKYNMWKNQQFITAIQSYEHALYTIWELQKKLMDHGVSEVILVTDNSTLHKWIENPKKNKDYVYWMEMANKKYRVGAAKEIQLGVGLYMVVKNEKSYKYCTDYYIKKKEPEKHLNSNNKGKVHKLEIDESSYKSVMDILEEDREDTIIIEEEGIREIY